MAKHIVIVCGYGPVLTDDLKMYLGRVVKYCNVHRPYALIFTGGFTRGTSLPHYSEAQVMLDYAEPLLYDLPYSLVEEDSYTTLDNIKNVAHILKSMDLPQKDTIVTIFCNIQKRFIMRHLARYFLKLEADVQPVKWKQEPWYLEFAVNVYTLVAMRIPSLAKRYATWRMAGYAKM